MLLLLHGLSATADVWQPLWSGLDRARPGRWVAVNLPGHGGSAPLARYSFGALAAAVAPAAAADHDPDKPLVVLGHSLGGVVGLALGSGEFGVRVTGVAGVGIKVAWTEAELAKASSLAARPVTWFDTRQSAAQRHLLVSGPAGLRGPDDEAVTSGLREQQARWRLALDPQAFAIGAPDLPGLLAAARAPVVLARGEHDPMVSTEQLERLVPDPVDLPGCGHNAHAERPDLLARLLERFSSGVT